MPAGFVEHFGAQPRQSGGHEFAIVVFAAVRLNALHHEGYDRSTSVLVGFFLCRAVRLPHQFVSEVMVLAVSTESLKSEGDGARRLLFLQNEADEG